MSATLATVVGTSQVSIDIKGKKYDFVPLDLRDMQEFLPVIEEFNRTVELRQDWEAEVKRWEMRTAEYDARYMRGENPGPSPGPKPEKPEALRQSGKHLEGTIKLVWAAIRKSGLSAEQIEKKEWAIPFESMLSIEWNRIDEINEALNSFFGRKMKGKTPHQGATAT